MHDEANESKEGDTVQIIESAPLSKKKRWTLVSVIEKSKEVDVAAMKAARKMKEESDGGKAEPAAAEAPAEG